MANCSLKVAGVFLLKVTGVIVLKIAWTTGVILKIYLALCFYSNIIYSNAVGSKSSFLPQMSQSPT